MPDDKLVRDTSTPEKKTWWEAVKAAATDAPRIDHVERMLDVADTKARLQDVSAAKTHWEGCEAGHIFCAAAKAIEVLEAECFALAADQCHGGYGDPGGHHRCRYQDRILELETYLKGFLWFLDQDILIRNVGHRYGDDEGAYLRERTRFVQWLKQAYKAAHEEDCLGVITYG